jgi:hypothetical protein
MSANMIIALVLAILIASLAISAITYVRQQTLAKRQAKVRHFKQQADELLAARTLLLSIEPDYELIIVLQKRMIHFITQACELMPLDPALQATLKKQQLSLIQFERQSRDNPVAPYLLNDGELNQALYLLTQLPKTLDLLTRQAVLSAADSERLQGRLRNLRLNLEVNSCLAQANEYARKNDLVMYQVRVKQARETLKKTSVPIGDREARMQLLSDALSKVKESHEVTVFNLGDK